MTGQIWTKRKHIGGNYGNPRTNSKYKIIRRWALPPQMQTVQRCP